jgi:hypothetical protein
MATAAELKAQGGIPVRQIGSATWIANDPTRAEVAAGLGFGVDEDGFYLDDGEGWSFRDWPIYPLSSGGRAQWKSIGAQIIALSMAGVPAAGREKIRGVEPDKIEEALAEFNVEIMIHSGVTAMQVRSLHARSVEIACRMPEGTMGLAEGITGLPGEDGEGSGLLSAAYEAVGAALKAYGEGDVSAKKAPPLEAEPEKKKKAGPIKET